MGRLHKTFAALPTHKLRNRVWARSVRFDLLPDLEPSRHGAHYMCGALNKRRVEEGSHSLGVFFTDSRWMDWWNGAHPTPAKVAAFASVLPSSPNWFEPHIALMDEHPLHTLLYSMDQLANPVNDLRIFEVLVSLQQKWGPSLMARENFGWNTCESRQFPNMCLSNQEATAYYSVLAPASIMRYMLWIGDAVRIKQRPEFRSWVFDLVSASISVFAIYNLRGPNAMMFSGTDGDVAAFIYRTFTRFEDNSDKIQQQIRYSSTKILPLIKVNPESSEQEGFSQLISQAAILFYNELKRYGISPSEIRGLDPCLYSKATAS